MVKDFFSTWKCSVSLLKMFAALSYIFDPKHQNYTTKCTTCGGARILLSSFTITASCLFFFSMYFPHNLFFAQSPKRRVKKAAVRDSVRCFLQYFTFISHNLASRSVGVERWKSEREREKIKIKNESWWRDAASRKINCVQKKELLLYFFSIYPCTVIWGCSRKKVILQKYKKRFQISVSTLPKSPK